MPCSQAVNEDIGHVAATLFLRRLKVSSGVGATGVAGRAQGLTGGSLRCSPLLVSALPPPLFLLAFARPAQLASDDETQAKIDVVEQRLIKFYGYTRWSATDVLNYVASIVARGDMKQGP